MALHLVKFIRKQMSFCVVTHFRKQIARRRIRKAQSPELIDLSTYVSVIENDGKKGIGLELPLFNFHMIAEATNNFGHDNKLGEGGYGPVYKGRLPKGEEIAVKRLSKQSGQGLTEFKNEVVLISKLQHRNLVRLLGCCIDGEEKLLLYEFMPNKSLDAFLFHPNKQGSLDWSRRCNIIEGIARGMLYLHRDSRLRIIHRDLKASNVLLDRHFNAKISDFGMARIFCVGQSEATTKKVVGTLGYMSPEYAMEGHFSEKSDVFSFGVLLLEIVSGRRNSYSPDDEEYTTLLGYAWTLWSENRALELIDQSLGKSFPQLEVIKCIQVGLLCVQEYPTDRPTMSSAVAMLSSDDATMPTPKQAAFFGRKDPLDLMLSSEICPANDLTITELNCR